MGEILPVRLRARVDANQKSLTAAFRDMGCDVLLTHQLGKGYPDCFVGYGGCWEPIEFKAKRGKLTTTQIKLRDNLQLNNWPGLVRTIDNAITVVNRLRQISLLSQHLKKADKAS